MTAALAIPNANFSPARLHKFADGCNDKRQFLSVACDRHGC